MFVLAKLAGSCDVGLSSLTRTACRRANKVERTNEGECLYTSAKDTLVPRTRASFNIAIRVLLLHQMLLSVFLLIAVLASSSSAPTSKSIQQIMPPTSRKRAHPGELTTKNMTDLLETILPETVPLLTNGALEGLRLAHEAFLQQVAAELAKSESKGIVQPKEVVKLLGQLGYADLAMEAVAKMEETAAGIASSGDVKGKKTKKKKSQQQWTTDMEAEQERLLALSRQTMVDNKADLP